MNYRFPKTARLLKRRDFSRMRKDTQHLKGRWMSLDIRSNQLSDSRIGITVSKRFGKAHLRNRFKRIVREAFRLVRHKIPIGIDINIRPSGNASQARLSDVVEEMAFLLAL